jgi:hypothetical protein
MFSYLGAKTRTVHLYPTPKHRLIIEPFAGSARYSLFHCDRDVWINDASERIARIWKWIQSASREDIENLPHLQRGQDVRQLKGLPDEARDLIGFACGRGQTIPANVLSGWAADTMDVRRMKCRLLDRLEDIRDWRVSSLDYLELPDIEATWFVDAPYQHAKHQYPENDIDYDELAVWCQSRSGQVIVCEAQGATWLPFEPLVEVWTAARRRMTECIWTKG